MEEQEQEQEEKENVEEENGCIKLEKVQAIKL